MAQLFQIDKWLARGKVKRAETQIARLLHNPLPTSEQTQLLLRRARVRLLLERPGEALEDLLKCQELTPELARHPEVQELLGDAYLARFELAPVGFAARADSDRALTIYQAITTQSPDYTNLGWVMYQWGRILLSRDQVDEAIDCIHKALLKQTTVPALSAFCYERLGFIYLIDKRDPGMALSFLARAANTYPRGAPSGWLVSLHLLRSRAFREQNLSGEAFEAARLALASVNPSDPDNRASLTECHLSLGDILAQIPNREREAANHLAQFLQYSRRPQGIDVTWSRVHETLGNLWFRLERYDQAIAAYRAALTYNPYHPWEVAVYYQIARSYYRLNEYARTINVIEKMQQAAQADQQPITDYRVYSLLANVQFALERYTEAAVTFQQAIDFAPPQADNLDELQAYLKTAHSLAQRR